VRRESARDFLGRVPMLMNSEQPLGTSAAAAAPIARFSAAATKRRAA